jgi:hypothetical protein
MNPTGGPVRNDKWGKGHFGASRGSRKHLGTDFCGMPGQWVVAPENGKVTGRGKPYGDSGPWDCYIRFQGKTAKWRLFYCRPLPGVRDRPVVKGQAIGRLMDVSTKYGAHPSKGRMRPHCHIEMIVDGEKVEPDVEP